MYSSKPLNFAIHHGHTYTDRQATRMYFAFLFDEIVCIKQRPIAIFDENKVTIKQQNTLHTHTHTPTSTPTPHCQMS